MKIVIRYIFLLVIVGCSPVLENKENIILSGLFKVDDLAEMSADDDKVELQTLSKSLDSISIDDYCERMKNAEDGVRIESLGSVSPFPNAGCKAEGVLLHMKLYNDIDRLGWHAIIQKKESEFPSQLNVVFVSDSLFERNEELFKQNENLHLEVKNLGARECLISYTFYDLVKVH